MNIIDLRKIFPNVDTIANLNPLTASEDYYFNKHSSILDKRDYREKAIDRVIQLKLSFSSTYNSAFNIFQRFISVKCPYCGSKTNYMQGGGSTGNYTVTYQCKSCGSYTYLTFDPDKIFATRSE